MRFSDLKRTKAESERKEPPPRAPARLEPVPEEPKREETPPAAVIAAEPAAPRPETVPPVADRQEAIKKHSGAYKPAPRKEPRVAAKPLPPFRDQDGAARALYSRLVEQAGELLKGADQAYTEKYEAVARTCDLAAETLRENPVLLNYAAHSTADDYLKAHSANTAIIALALGLAAGLEASELRLLGFCAMAHDIGMTDYADLYTREGRLTEEEFSRITQHAEAGAEKLDRIVDIDYRIKDRAKKILLQVHERLDGSGYPRRFSKEDLDPLAQLIGIADVYEAMTHPRAWREALEPPDVVKDLIECEGRGFDCAAVRHLISALSIYPPQSLVVLSTGEIARVIRLNKGSLTRPLVEVLLTEDFAPAPAQTLDLMEYPLTAIEGPVSLAEIQERNPKFAARLELARWWVNW